ncbi:MAG: hypothetical protein JW953_15035 [Anaerolineae bacterium]|nr:hypothetical protein [Anaerolineae bacterium]
MSNLPNILSVAIGLILLYYVLSLVVSYITTAINQWTEMRAKDLKYVLKERLQDADLYERFMNHPLIKNLRPMQVKMMGREIQETDVTDIPATTFATALLDILTPDSAEEDKLAQAREFIKELPEGDMKTALKCVIDSTVENIQTARQNLELWYNDVMKNVSLLYTQHARHIAIICALVVTMALDADSIAVANRLWVEPALRAVAVAKAEEYINQAPDPETVDIVGYVAELEELQIPILWSVPLPQDAPGWLLKVFGWAITWLAVAQGSSFWYDVLKRVRSATSGSSDKSATT